jgi:hypothetical protein
LLSDGTGQIFCARDATAFPMARGADATWETALVNVIQHSVQLAGAFVDAYVLPDHF